MFGAYAFGAGYFGDANAGPTRELEIPSIVSGEASFQQTVSGDGSAAVLVEGDGSQSVIVSGLGSKG